MAKSQDFPGAPKPDAPTSQIRGLRRNDPAPEPNVGISVSQMLENQRTANALAEGGTKDESPTKPSPAAVGEFEKNEESEFGEFISVDVAKLKKSPFQPRIVFSESEIEELANSIQTVGLVKPILVRPLADGWFELVGGERRWRAHKLLGKQKIMAQSRHLTDAMAMVLALTDNEGQEPLTEYERGRGYKKILSSKEEPSMRALSRRLGVNVSIVSRCLLLTEFPEEILDILDVNPGLVGGTAAKGFVDYSKEEPELTKNAILLIRNEQISQEQALRWIAKEIASRNPSSSTRLIDKKVAGFGTLRVDGKKMEFRCEKDLNAQRLGEQFEVFLKTLNREELKTD
ncbi:ParB/RepB/Spo0J family partition protein [Pseudomonas sp. MDT1-17]